MPSLAVRDRRQLAIRILALAAAYFLAGWLGLIAFASVPKVSLIWLPTGIAVAALVRWGLICWPGIFLGQFAMGISNGVSPGFSAAIAIGNVVGPLLSTWLLRRFDFRPGFKRRRDILFLSVAAALGMALTATNGVATLSLAGFIPAGQHLTEWLRWWVGDWMGVIAAAPLLLLAGRTDFEMIRWRAREFSLCVFSIAAVAAGVFVINTGRWSLAFVPLPLIAWAALRFGVAGNSIALLLLFVTAAYGTALGHGPFGTSDPIGGIAALWIFIVAAAILGWLITALHSQLQRVTGIQRLLERALSDGSLGVLLTDPAHNITYANAGFTRLTGYTEAELLGKNCRLLQGPDTDPQTIAQIRAALRDEGFFEGEVVNYRKTGESFWNAIAISPIRDERNTVTGFLGIQRDVTKRKAAEQALQSSEEHLRTIVALDPECVALLSPAGEVLEMNPAGLAMVEAGTFEEVRGRSFAELVEPAHRPIFSELHSRALRSEPGHGEYSIVGLRGARRWLEAHSVPYRNGRREVVGVLALARDVTRRKEAEGELQRSFSTLELFINSVPAFISFVDTEERYRLVNRRYEEYFGLSSEQFVGRRLRDVQPPTAYAEMQPHVQKVLAGHEVHYESNPVSPDGRRHWFDVRYNPRRSPEGVVLGFFVLVFDITERKQAELRSTSERTILEMLAAGAPLSDVLKAIAHSQEAMCPGMLCSVLLLDAEGKRLRHGAAPSLPREYCEATNGIEIGPRAGSCGTAAYTRRTVLVDDIANDPLWEGFSEVPLAHGLRACWSVPIISSQGAVIGTFALYYRQPHQVQPGEVAAIERGAHFAALAIERHQLLDSLRESRTRLETLISNLPGIAFRCLDDADWTVIFVSDHCETITGYRRDELEGNRVISFENLIHPEDRATLRANCHASLAARLPCCNEYRIIDRSGVTRWVSERSTGVYDASGTLLYLDGFIQDITAAREAAREREEFARKVQETQKLESLGVLAGGIAHDFNNILTAILGNASLALSDATPGTMLHDCLDDISNASLRATELCSQMLAYSGRGHFIVQKLELSQLIHETTQMLHLSISKKATLQFEFAKHLPPFEADATQIRQVIMNLVINASEAVGESGGVITLRTGLCFMDRAALDTVVTVPDAPEGDYVYLEVSDNGCGMSAETQARIFEPFFTTKFTGRGLGLAAVLGIVRGHHGALRVGSEIGRGTSFRLMFPASSGPVESHPQPPATPSVWRGQGTVLVVDDEAPVRATVVRMLQTMGFEAIPVNDGREAVRIFREAPSRFAAVLLDLTMPNLSGEQTFVELRRLQPGVQVVLMSGYNEQEAAHRFSDIGLKHFVQKPFDVEALREMLRAALA